MPRYRTGALDLRSIVFKDDPRPLWRSLHAGPGVVVTRQPLLGRVALATHHAEATRVLQDSERFVLDARRVGRRAAGGLAWWVPAAFRPLTENLLTREGEEHRDLRARVDSAFHRPRLDALQPRIEQIVDEALHALRRSTDGDFVAHVARPVPQRVIGELLGLDALGRDAPDRALAFERALSTLSNVHGATDLLRALPAIRVIDRTLRGEIERRRREPREDLLSELIASTGPTHPGHRLGDDELLSMIFLLYVAGHETTTHLMSTAVLTLLREPGARAHVVEQPPGIALISELLRYLSPVQMSKPRFVTLRTDIGGVTLRRGDTIAALVGSANMDPRWIEDGYRFDPTRRAKRHLAFGGGAHVCLGLQLALRETRTVLDALFTRCPDVVLADERASPAWTRRLGLRALRRLPLGKTSGRTGVRTGGSQASEPETDGGEQRQHAG